MSKIGVQLEIYRTIPGIAMVHHYFIDNSQTMHTRKETINQYNSLEIGLQGKKKFVSKGAHNVYQKNYNHEN